MRRFMRLGAAVIPLSILFMANMAAYAETLFPKTSMVRQKCSACHKPDAKGRLEVIRETRKTPEEWKVVVDRMVRINSAPLEDSNFNAVIKELSKNLVALSIGDL